jgi:hypothetical protein
LKRLLPEFLQKLFGIDGDGYKDHVYLDGGGNHQSEFPFMKKFCDFCGKFDESASAIEDFVIYKPSDNGDGKFIYLGERATLCRKCVEDEYTGCLSKI